MRIAMLSSFYFPHIGGTERYVQDLSRALAERGHEVTIYTHTSGYDRADDCENPRVVRLPAIWFPYWPLASYLPLRRLRRMDVIHSNGPPFAFTQQVVRQGRRIAVPHVVTYHCDFETPDVLGRLRVPRAIRRSVDYVFNKTARRNLQRVDRIIATTRSYADSSVVLDRLPVDVVPIGVNLDPFEAALERHRRTGIERDPTEILYVGRLAANKGLHLLIDAVTKLRDRGVKFRLTIVGDGEEALHLRFLVLQRRLHKSVVFAGRVGFEQLTNHYARAAVLVLPSFVRLEAFGIVQIEALAMGLPVIASDLPGMNEIVNTTGGGLLFPARSVDKLCDQLEAVLRGPDALWRQAEAARPRVIGTYHRQSVAAKFESIYTSLRNA